MLIDFTKVVDFYNQINLLYGAITEFCSPQSCPEMKATDEYAALAPSRILNADYMQVRVSVARQRKLQEAHQDVRARICRTSHGVGAE